MYESSIRLLLGEKCRQGMTVVDFHLLVSVHKGWDGNQQMEIHLENNTHKYKPRIVLLANDSVEYSGNSHNATLYIYMHIYTVKSLI